MYEVLGIWCLFYLSNTCRFRLVTFQMLIHHMWLVTVELDSRALNCYFICSEADDFIGEREMRQKRGVGGRSLLDMQSPWHQISQTVHSFVGHLTFKPKH